MALDRSRPREPPLTGFLLLLLTVSLLTNAILFTRLYYPFVWRRLQTAFVSAPSVASTDHRRGSPTARVTVIEYSDLQCPYSAQFHASMRALLAKTDTAWVYRHFPIDRIHPFAIRAAEACECAGEQGKFWEYADALFESRAEFSEERLIAPARPLGLDRAVLERCLASGRFRGVVAAHREDGIRRKIDATPTFFVNGERVEGALPYEALKRLVTGKGARAH